MSFAKPLKIFIIDDDAMLTEALTDYLTRKAPHQVQVYHTGEAALPFLTENPDVIVLDYFLNSVDKDAADGMKILQAIKKISPRTRVIMLSSQERYAVAVRTIQEGAVEYVIKDEAAFEKIARLLESK